MINAIASAVERKREGLPGPFQRAGFVSTLFFFFVSYHWVIAKCRTSVLLGGSLVLEDSPTVSPVTVYCVPVLP